MKSFVFISLLFALVVAGCRVTNTGTVSSSKDSSSIDTVRETIYKDKIITVPGQTTTLHDTVPCPEVNYTNEKKTGSVTASVTIKDGKLDVKCEADSLRQVINGLQETITTIRASKIKVSTAIVTNEVKVIPKWVVWCLVISGAINIILLLVIRLRK